MSNNERNYTINKKIKTFFKKILDKKNNIGLLYKCPKGKGQKSISKRATPYERKKSNELY